MELAEKIEAALVAYLRAQVADFNVIPAGAVYTAIGGGLYRYTATTLLVIGQTYQYIAGGNEEAFQIFGVTIADGQTFIHQAGVGQAYIYGTGINPFSGLVTAQIIRKNLATYFDPATQIQPGESDADITAQVIRCIAGDASQEYPQGSGNFRFPVVVELLTPIAAQTAAEAASDDVAQSTSQIDKHKAIAAILETAIMVNNLPALLTAAVDDFTCIGILDRLPQRGQAADLYVSGFTFLCYAAGADL